MPGIAVMTLAADLDRCIVRLDSNGEPVNDDAVVVGAGGAGTDDRGCPSRYYNRYYNSVDLGVLVATEWRGGPAQRHSVDESRPYERWLTPS
jgi:hypothetical protein